MNTFENPDPDKRNSRRWQWTWGATIFIGAISSVGAFSMAFAQIFNDKMPDWYLFIGGVGAALVAVGGSYMASGYGDRQLIVKKELGEKE